MRCGAKVQEDDRAGNLVPARIVGADAVTGAAHSECAPVTAAVTKTFPDAARRPCGATSVLTLVSDAREVVRQLTHFRGTHVSD